MNLLSDKNGQHEEIAVKLGLIDEKNFEVDVMGRTGLTLSLYTPFLLGFTAHADHTWSHILSEIQVKLNLTLSLLNVLFLRINEPFLLENA